MPAGDYNKTTRSAADKALPNTYLRDETFLKFPYKGRALGSTSAIAIDKDGKSVWIAERCGGQDVCNDSTVAMIIKFDPDGKVVKMFGAGEIYYPHGLYVDRDGNLWVADLQSNVDRPSRGGGPKPTAPAGTVPNGNQIVKYSPEGRILLKLGVPGVYGTDEKHFGQPSFAITAANGDIFVADGHDTPETNQRIVKFDKTGKFLKTWGTRGKGQSEFDCPHALAIDSQGRLFVADRGNDRIQIFDAEGKFIAEWKQFGKPSGLYIDKNDVLYAADSESSVRNNNEYIRGVHIGSAKTGEVTAFLQDPLGNPAPWNPLRGTTGAEGITVDANGVIYVSQVTPPALARYTKK